MNYALFIKKLFFWAFVLLFFPVLSSCVSFFIPQSVDFVCSHELDFSATLFGDAAIVRGVRGGDVKLTRVAGSDDFSPVYFDSFVRAEFGLGSDGNLARLFYGGLSEPISCERVLSSGDFGKAPRVKAHVNSSPAPLLPYDPNAPVWVNYKTLSDAELLDFNALGN